MPKQRLIKKFEAHGVKRNVLKWIHNWLTGRKLRVVLNGKSSDWCDVTSGVPQGSVLGPLAFIVFINDIDGCTDNLMKISKFADDTKLSHQQEDHHHIQEALDKLVDWADTWGHGFQHSQVQGSSYREKKLLIMKLILELLPKLATWTTMLRGSKKSQNCSWPDHTCFHL